jgi:hypothetical protein
MFHGFKKRNTASILAIMLVGTICWVVVSKDKYEFLSPLVHIVFDVVGFYFDSKPGTGDDDVEGLWAPL